MNDKLIDALFSVSCRIREIRNEMERLTEDSSETDLLNKQAVLQNQSKKYHQLNLKLMLVLIKKT